MNKVWASHHRGPKAAGPLTPHHLFDNFGVLAERASWPLPAKSLAALSRTKSKHGYGTLN